MSINAIEKGFRAIDESAYFLMDYFIEILAEKESLSYSDVASFVIAGMELEDHEVNPRNKVRIMNAIVRALLSECFQEGIICKEGGRYRLID